jgi:ABC-type dipeptide/oligopeptide/nickel transport system permease component
LWVTSILVFAGTEILPGDVVEVVLGQAATPESVAAIRKSMSLDQPAHIRYVRWLTRAVQGDFGRSLAGDVAGTAESGRPVSGLIGERLPNSLLLAATTAALAVPLALLTGLLSRCFLAGYTIVRFDRCALRDIGAGVFHRLSARHAVRSGAGMAAGDCLPFGQPNTL